MSITHDPFGVNQRQKRYTVFHGGICAYSHGVSLRRTRPLVIPSSCGRNSAKRAKITYFSSSASARLRRAILTLSHPDLGALCGLTLTLPWHIDGGANERQLERFRVAWHAFQIGFSDLFPGSALLYRHELQTRGAPHTHALLYLSRTDFAALVMDNRAYACGQAVCNPAAGSRCRIAKYPKIEAVSRSDNPATVGRDGGCKQPASQAETALFVELRSFLHSKITALWGRVLRNTHEPWARRAYLSTGFARHGVSVDSVRGHGQMAAYLADHATKHKQEQLGYQGKQWGIIGRCNLYEDIAGQILRDDGDAYSTRIIELYGRALSRMARYTTFASKVAQTREKRASALYKRNPSRLKAAFNHGFEPAWVRYGSKKARRRNAFCGVKWISPDAQYRLFSAACEQAAFELFNPSTTKERL